MQTKTQKSYFNCILKKFTLEDMKNGNISLKDFIVWYESFKRAYTSSKCILNVLNDIGYKHIIEFEKYLTEKSDCEKEMSDIYSKCVKLGYTDTISNMKIVVKYVKENYLDKLTEKQAVILCENNQDRYTLVPNKIIILKVLGYDTDHLLKILDYRENRLDYLRSVAHKLNTRIKYIKEIDQDVGGITKISEKSIEELVSIAKKFSHKSIIMRVYKLFLNETVVSQVQNILSHTYSNMNKVEFFFSKRKTTQLREIFENVIHEHISRLKKSSAYVEDRVKDLELRIVSFLEFINEKICDVKNEEPILTFFTNATNQEIYDVVLEYGRESSYNNERVKSKNGKHHQAKQRVNTAIRFLSDISNMCKSGSYMKSLKSSEFLLNIENKSEILDWDKRRVYTDEEINRMIKISDKSPQDVLMITILSEIGLRNAAVCNLKFSDIVDETGNPKHICRIKEKGNKIREFITSNNIKIRIISYLRSLEKYTPSNYVFSRTPCKRLGYSTLNVILKRIAIQAGVTDVNVQAHSFRHTLVGKLMDAGNRIEVVSKFMGHSSVDTTMTYYWLKNIKELSDEINNPFIKTNDDPKSDEIEYLNKKLDVCFSIIGLYKTEIDTASDIDLLKKKLFQHSHRINRVLKFIADSSIRDDSTTIANFEKE